MSARSTYTATDGAGYPAHLAGSWRWIYVAAQNLNGFVLFVFVAWGVPARLRFHV